MRTIDYCSRASLAGILEMIRARAGRTRVSGARAIETRSTEARAIEAPAWTLTPSDRFQPEGDHAAIGVVVRPWSRSGMAPTPGVPRIQKKFAGAFVAGHLVVLLACHNPCRRTEVGRYPSPEVSVAALLIEHDCGATTSIGTDLVIERSYLGLWTRRARVASVAGIVVPSVTWESDRELLWQLTPDVEVLSQVAEQWEIRVRVEGGTPSRKW